MEANSVEVLLLQSLQTFVGVQHLTEGSQEDSIAKNMAEERPRGGQRLTVTNIEASRIIGVLSLHHGWIDK